MIKRFEREIKEQRKRLTTLHQKGQGVGVEASGEYIALKEMKLGLKRKGLTPEAFYRVCDTNMIKDVPVESFRSALEDFSLGLSRGQISRIILILDED